MFTKNVAGSRIGAALPTPLFDITNQEDADLEAIDQAARELSSDEDAASTPPVQKKQVDEQVTQIRSRFFAGSSEAEDTDRTASSPSSSTKSPHTDSDFQSPEYSPSGVILKMTPDTPQAVEDLKAVLEDNQLGFNLNRQDKNSFVCAMSKMSTLQSPHKEKNAVRRLFADAFVGTGSATEIPSAVAQPRRLVFSSNNPDDISSDWAIEAAQVLKFSILKVAHLSDLEEGGGFHICGLGHPRDAFVRLRRTNLLTGVWCGAVYNEQNQFIKFSSFIPRQLQSRRFQFLVAKAINSEDCLIAQESNRRLYRVDDQDRSFVIECYFQEEGTVISSTFPVFHYEVYYKEKTSFKVPYSFKWSLADNDPIVPCTYEVIYAQFFDLLETYPKAIIYKMKDKVVVDLGVLYRSNPIYGSCPIDQGLLVEIPREFLPFE